MFFDAGCGPCTFFARVTVGLSRSRVETHPLDGPDADRALGSMSADLRYGYFHIVEPGMTRTGRDAMPAWVGLIGGPRLQRLAERAPPVNDLLRFAYDRFWGYRRSRGCAAEAGHRA
jgi:hypothetical protein